MNKLNDYFEKYEELNVKCNLEGEEALAAVQQDGYALRYVNNQTERICLAAVQQDGNALQYVNNQTEAICLAAVQQYGYALQYVNTSLFHKDKIKVICNGKTVYISKESAKVLGLA